MNRPEKKIERIGIKLTVCGVLLVILASCGKLKEEKHTSAVWSRTFTATPWW